MLIAISDQSDTKNGRAVLDDPMKFPAETINRYKKVVFTVRLEKSKFCVIECKLNENELLLKPEWSAAKLLHM